MIFVFIFFRFPDLGVPVLNIWGLAKANRVFFKSPILILCFLFNFFNASVLETFYTWFTSYFAMLNKEINISSVILFLFSLAVLTGVFIKKYLVRFVKESKILLFNVLFSIFFLTLNLFVNNFIIKAIIIFMFGLSLSGNYILIISLGLKDIKEKYSASSRYLQGAEYMGIIIFQSLSGILSEHMVKSGIIYMNLSILLFLLVIVLLIKHRRRTAV